MVVGGLSRDYYPCTHRRHPNLWGFLDRYWYWVRYIGLMSLNLATLNERRMGDPKKCSHLLGELTNLGVNVATVQETHFTCAADCQVLEDDYVVLPAYSNHSSVGVFQVVRCSLNTDVNLAFADEGNRLVVADVAIKSFKFGVVAIYAPNIAAEQVSFIQQLALFLNDPKWTVFVGDWNAILDPKIDTFHFIEQTDHRLVMVNLRLVNRSSLAGKWKFNTSLLEIRDFWNWLESLISRR